MKGDAAAFASRPAVSVVPLLLVAFRDPGPAQGPHWPTGSFLGHEAWDPGFTQETYTNQELHQMADIVKAAGIPLKLRNMD